MRRIVAGVVAVIGLGMITAVVLGLLMIYGGRELRHKNQAELRAATPTMAGDELRMRGHHLARPLVCQDMPGATKRHMRVSCSGATTDHTRVLVIGTAEDKVKEEYFTILLGGRPLVQNVECLGPNCRPQRR